MNKRLENILISIGLCLTLCASFGLVYVGVKGMHKLEQGYDKNFQLDVLAKKCIHTGYGEGRSSEKIYVCQGYRTMRRGPQGFLETVK